MLPLCLNSYDTMARMTSQEIIGFHDFGLNVENHSCFLKIVSV